MAKIIEFYIPQSFCKVSKWVPTTERGKLLAFPLVQNDNRRDLFLTAPGETEIDHDEATTSSDQGIAKKCSCVLLVPFGLAQEKAKTVCLPRPQQTCGQ